MTYNPTNTYNPRNWYWNIGGVIYSSAAEAVIAEPSVAYDAWKVANTASPMDTWANLDTILANYNLGPTGMVPPTQAQLLAAAYAKVAALMSVARTYALPGSVSVKCDGTTQTGADLAGLNAWGATAPTATTTWVDDFGVPSTITGAQGIALAAAVILYGQSVYDVLGTVASSIASGSITTLAQVQSAAWPA